VGIDIWSKFDQFGGFGSKFGHFPAKPVAMPGAVDDMRDLRGRDLLQLL